MNEIFLIKHLHAWVDNKKFPYQVPRAFIYNWECDYWVLDIYGATREFEIKISRSDFLVDKKKDKHNKHDEGANYFYYVCPKDLIKKDEVHQKYGLIYVWDSGHVEIAKKPQKLNDKKFDDWKMLCNKMFYKWYALWRQKWIDKEITRDEYFEDFNISLSENVPLTSTTPLPAKS